MTRNELEFYRDVARIVHFAVSTALRDGSDERFREWMDDLEGLIRSGQNGPAVTLPAMQMEQAKKEKP